jgi:hypothetical protein
MNGFRNDSHHTPSGGFRGGDSEGGGGDGNGGRATSGSYPPVAEIFASAAEKVNEMRQYPVCQASLCFRDTNLFREDRTIARTGEKSA